MPVTHQEAVTFAYSLSQAARDTFLAVVATLTRTSGMVLQHDTRKGYWQFGTYNGASSVEWSKAYQ